MSKQTELDKESEGKTQERDWIVRLWEFFTSMKLGLILFLLIAVASIIGTVIEQGMPEQSYDPQWYPLYKALNLTDAYHSWWYLLLLNLLVMNLFICTLNRFQPLLKAYREPLTRVSSNFLKKLKNYHGEGVRQASAESADAVAGLLKKGGFSVIREEEGKQIFLYGEKGKFGPWGSFITHVAFITIVVGALIGTKFGYEGTAAIPVGQTLNVSQIENFERMNPDKNFQLRIDEFRTLYREDNSVKDWISTIHILDGQTDKSVDIRVNHPAEYNGIKMYQTSWGSALRVKLNLDGKEEETWLNSDGNNPNEVPIRIPNTDYTILVMNQYNNMITASTNTPQSPDGKTPLVAYAIFKGNQMQEMKVPEFNKPIAIGDKATITFLEYAPMTGLSFRYDPGVPVVWIGSFLLVLGMLISFYTPHRRVWAILSDDQGHTSLEIGGQAQKNKMGFEREFAKLIEEWKLSTKH